MDVDGAVPQPAESSLPAGEGRRQKILRALLPAKYFALAGDGLPARGFRGGRVKPRTLRAKSP